MPVQKYEVKLTDAERASLGKMLHSGSHPARALNRARILLGSDAGKSAEKIAAEVGIHAQTVYNTRKKYCDGAPGKALEALSEKPRPGAPAKFDGIQRGQLTALACSAPPEGRARWTLQLLADKVVELKFVESISDTSVERILKKTKSSRTARPSGASVS